MTGAPPVSLASVASEVLETMFFSPVIGLYEAPPDGAGGRPLSVHIGFLRNSLPSGRLEVSVSPEGAQSIASSFLAADEDAIPEHQVNDVICEVANVICGSLLSRGAQESPKAGGFRMLSPEIVRSPEPNSSAECVAREALELERGWISLSWWLGAA